MFRRAVRTGAVVVLVAGLGVAVSGDIQGKIMTEVQPMKMAAAEALYDDRGSRRRSRSSPSAASTGRRRSSPSRCPACCRSWPPAATTGEVVGINELREQYQAEYGSDPGAAYYSPGDYTPIIPLDLLVVPADDRARAGWPPPIAGVAPVGHPTRAGPDRPGAAVARGRRCRSCRCCANSFGWIFTEMGRQPWAVFGLMTTANAVSPGVARRRGADLADRASPCCTACWPSSRSG